MGIKARLQADLIFCARRFKWGYRDVMEMPVSWRDRLVKAEEEALQQSNSGGTSLGSGKMPVPNAPAYQGKPYKGGLSTS